MTSLMWFRRDLRLSDNPALAAAHAAGRPIVPVYVLDDADAGAWAPGAASRWWLHGSLAALATRLAAYGSRLILRRGPARPALARLIAETGARAVFWNRAYEPWARARDAALKAELKRAGLAAHSFNAALLAEPWEVATRQGAPFRVFTPFWRALQARGDPPAPLPAPAAIPAPAAFPASDALETWQLRPTKPDWAAGLRATWQPGEAGAQVRLAAFLDAALLAYADGRDRPDRAGTSRLSPHLHFGDIGPRQVWHACVASAIARTGAAHPRGVERYLAELGWREFAHHLLFHAPTLAEQPLRPAFAAFPWIDDAAALRAWQRGATGYPIVDAGLRELWHTGWMHNRVRMIAASFLVKDLLIDWRRGAAWFWDTLVDADLANNAASWQWVAGCGTDAAPFFRIFNPVLQGAKFDPTGAYVRRWVPELAKLPDPLLQAPWRATPLELADAGVRLGETYPLPIVDHASARAAALAAFQRVARSEAPSRR